MEYSKETNPLADINYCNRVLFYLEENHELEILRKELNEEYLEICVEDALLKNLILDRYGIENFPCILYYGITIYCDKKMKQNMYRVNSSKSIILENRIKNLIISNKVMLFMKGSLNQPYCRFSKSLVEILNNYNIPDEDLRYYDVMMNDEMKEVTKKVNNWPTFPQIFINGKFMGGVDILKDLHDKGYLKHLLFDNCDKPVTI